MGATSFIEEIKSDVPYEVNNEWNRRVQDSYDSDDSNDSTYPNSLAGVGSLKFDNTIPIFMNKDKAADYILDNTDKWGNGLAVKISIDGKKPRQLSIDKRKKEIEKIEEIKEEADKMYKEATLAYKRELKNKYDENHKLEKPKLILIKCENCRSQINLDYYKNQFYFSTEKINCFVCKKEFIDSKIFKEYSKNKLKYEKLYEKIKDKPLYHYMCGGWSPC